MSSRVTSHPDNELSGAQKFFYCNRFGRLLLKGILVRPWVSKLAGWYMDGRMSTMHVKGFIRSNGIDMSDYPERKYRSFNDFFTRTVKEGARPINEDPHALIAPCDARLSVYEIQPDSSFSIKGGRYTVAGLLRSEQLAKHYEGGLCLIFRLAVDNYHRYCYIDSGRKGTNVFLKGRLHTVHPVALKVCDIYKENSREYSILRTDNFGDVVQVEVGAMMVGRICNNHQEASFARGEEKGRFEFGGSTVVLLLQKGVAELDPEFAENTAQGLETAVRMGEAIGRAVRN
ncbi:MAG: phosphatidylserine decarboxylase [Ruminococcaceae bacterium]|nr:phosphatidylserine decarboxylase [Oscillospiraceae bacterium]